MKDLISRLSSRKFLLTIGVVAFAALGAATGQLSFDAALELARNAVVAYLAAEGAADAVKAYKAR